METKFAVLRKVSGRNFQSLISVKERQNAQFFYYSIVSMLQASDKGRAGLYENYQSGVEISAITQEEGKELEQKVTEMMLQALAWEAGTGTLTITAVAYQPALPAVGTTIEPVALRS
ncbi:MAG: hypothetical protein Greene071421_152 [Parcubacteria group bacterium Greene0714_21]|nr:MAG: hypothetical protein Greene041639_200 [Parcubacteria group bacterium Greene0416_39]TSC98555.1 MAG: hypothetical protein Greene101447_57 [Parcubacteria group bacterium Greene1014_47]TSD04316.1 MAG: hypothetical protein Greene071421_152 [Parcubacteria group bacterium Greene0714_21]